MQQKPEEDHVQQKPNRVLKLDTRIYRNFDADYTRGVPAEGFGGWTTMPVELPLAGRRYTELALLSPGVAASTLNPTTRGPGWFVANGNYHR